MEGGVRKDAVLRTSPPADAAARRRGPIDPRLLRRASATRWYLAGGVLIGCLTAGLTVVQAWALASGIAGVFAASRGEATIDGLGWVVPTLAAVFAGKALLTWLNTFLAARAATAVKSQLRADIMRARLARPVDPGVSTPALVTLVTQGLDALDGFYSKYLPQLLLAVTVPMIVGVAILTADGTSAVIVALTVPLIPLFMALVGWTTEARTRKRWRVQTRLAQHFADLVEGLPTLQVFGRARAQAEGLRRTEAAHRGETMATLRLSFLSALVLELLATLAVAVVAVTVGFRVVAGDLDLQTALFVLILAPEAYLPVRQVGVHYHDAADGMAAAESAFAVIEGAAPAEAGVVRVTDAGAGLLVQVADLTHTYPGAARPAVEGVSFDVAPGEFVVLTGPSGGGKTTVLNALAGFVEPRCGAAGCAGSGPDGVRRSAAGHGQRHDRRQRARLGDAGASDATVADALARAGASELAADRGVGDDGEGLSAGERRRVAVARALLRLDAGADLLLLDEPTAGLDADAEAALLDSLRASGKAAVVVTHRPAVIARADQIVTIGGGS